MNRCQDISISDASLKAEFITKFFNGDYIDAFTIISNNPQLNTKAFVADTINQIATILLSLENNFQNGVIDYLAQQYSNFQNIIDNYNLRGNWSASTTYQIYNFVTYNNIDYLYINLIPSSGNLPTNTEYWVEVNIQGEKGAPGLGVNLQYNWSATTPYNALDVVYYNNALWVARVDNINKIPGSTEEWETLSGSIVSFYNDGDIEISNLSVDVEPVQDTSGGDPSPTHICPISGWDAVEVDAAGANLLDDIDPDVVECYIDPTTKKIRSNNKNRSVIVPVKPNTSYFWAWNPVYIQGSPPSDDSGYVLFDEYPTADVTVGTQAAYSTGVISTGPNTKYMVLKISNIDRTDFQATLSASMLSVGSSAVAHEPYQGNRYTIQLGQTVYGGTLDIAEDGSVEMLVDRAIVDMGTMVWSLVSGIFTSNTLFSIKKKGASNLICSAYPTSTVQSWSSVPDKHCVGNIANGAVYVKDTAYPDAATFKAAMSGVQFVYELDTPIEIQLDPVTISTISGQINNVWADAGDVTVKLNKKYWEEFIEFKLASIYTDYIEPSVGSLYNGLIWFEVFNPQNWSYLTNRNYTWNQINTNNDTWESVDRGDY